MATLTGLALGRREAGKDVMTHPNVTVIGLQWGDEGKGKIVDALARKCRYVVRYCGGANAGHTVTVDEQRFAMHLIPCGILHEGVHNVIANGVAFDPAVALEEIQGLRERGVRVGPENLHISSAANVVMPYHKLADRLSEASLGAAKLGTTARGIGPCYADKAHRAVAIRVGDLLEAEPLREKIAAVVKIKKATFSALYGSESTGLDAEAIWREYEAYAQALAPMVTNTGAMLRRALDAGERICFEGGQGSMLDIDHGTFPFVTSSAVTACGVPQGAGVPPKVVGHVVGVAKAYSSRVGAGPFPTEQDNEIGERIRQRGREYGTTTGRPRRCGWLDAVAVRYAAELSGVDELAVVLLDVLSGFDRVRICTGYKIDGKVVDEFDPSSARLQRVECVYEELPGWGEEIMAADSYGRLPDRAQAYVDRIEELIGRPVGIISVGPRREQTIVHDTQLKGLI